jgi:RNA polymerase sigma-70 factor (ECF subfamily)
MVVTTEQVWENFNGPLKQFIRKRVDDEQNTEDILQDVFLKIHAHIDTLKDEQKLQSWMYQIARNAVSDHYRERSLTYELPDQELGKEEAEDDRDIIAELAPCIRAMIADLPPLYREALILTEYGGLSQKELGEKVGISFSGAKSRVQRAREKLKQMLLNCCHFEFDRLGSVIDYQPICSVCCSYRHLDSKEYRNAICC